MWKSRKKENVYHAQKLLVLTVPSANFVLMASFFLASSPSTNWWSLPKFWTTLVFLVFISGKKLSFCYFSPNFLIAYLDQIPFPSNLQLFLGILRFPLKLTKRCLVIFLPFSQVFAASCPYKPPPVSEAN